MNDETPSNSVTPYLQLFGIFIVLTVIFSVFRALVFPGSPMKGFGSIVFSSLLYGFSCYLVNIINKTVQFPVLGSAISFFFWSSIFTMLLNAIS